MRQPLREVSPEIQRQAAVSPGCLQHSQNLIVLHEHPEQEHIVNISERALVCPAARFSNAQVYDRIKRKFAQDVVLKRLLFKM